MDERGDGVTGERAAGPVGVSVLMLEDNHAIESALAQQTTFDDYELLCPTTAPRTARQGP